MGKEVYRTDAIESADTNDRMSTHGPMLRFRDGLAGNVCAASAPAALAACVDDGDAATLSLRRDPSSSDMQHPKRHLTHFEMTKNGLFVLP